MVVMHDPQKNCEKRGDGNLWSLLPKDRSLFTCKKGYGIAIGNLTSQIFANFYLMEFDYEMEKLFGNRYRRYVDDITITGTRYEVLNAIPFIRKYLNDNLEITLHPKKIYIQQVSKGITFIGYSIKGNRFYTNNRTVNNMLRAINIYNELADEDKDNIINWLELFQQRMNSYLGFMKHTNSYAIRWNMWNAISDTIKKYVYMKNMEVIKVRNKYRSKTILINKYYGKTSF